MLTQIKSIFFTTQTTKKYSTAMCQLVILSGTFLLASISYLTLSEGSAILHQFQLSATPGCLLLHITLNSLALMVALFSTEVPYNSCKDVCWMGGKWSKAELQATLQQNARQSRQLLLKWFTTRLHNLQKGAEHQNTESTCKNTKTAFKTHKIFPHSTLPTVPQKREIFLNLFDFPYWALPHSLRGQKGSLQTAHQSFYTHKGLKINEEIQ